MEVEQVEASGSDEKQKNEVSQQVDANEVVGALLASKVSLQKRELKVAFSASPWQERNKDSE